MTNVTQGRYVTQGKIHNYVTSRGGYKKNVRRQIVRLGQKIFESVCNKNGLALIEWCINVTL